MKNADKPAAPTFTHDVKADLPLHKTDNTGLTKREIAAIHAMQGLIASNAMYNGKTDRRDLLAADAVAHADAVLAELEK